MHGTCGHDQAVGAFLFCPRRSELSFLVSSSVRFLGAFLRFDRYLW
jgi:hypothetical protein